jgi:hypothetical protein
MKNLIKRIGISLAGLGVVAGSVGVATLPAQAVHTDQKICNSSNSDTNVIDWRAGYGTSEFRTSRTRTIFPGQCLYVSSADVTTMQLEVVGKRFRVGYDKKPYKAWQSIDGYHKVFRQSDNDLIWIQTSVFSS